MDFAVISETVMASCLVQLSQVCAPDLMNETYTLLCKYGRFWLLKKKKDNIMGAKNANAKGSKFRDRSHCDCVHLLNTGIEVDHRLCSSTVCVCGGGVFGCLLVV